MTRRAAGAAAALWWLALSSAAPAAPTTYTVVPGPGQKIRFDAKTPVETYAGTTDQVSGEVRVDPDRPGHEPSARFEVKLSSLRTGNGSRDSNMRRRFLETDKFPTAAFVLNRLEGPAGTALTPGRTLSGTARGTFTLHGVMRDIAPAVTVTRERDRAGRDRLHIVARFVVRLDEHKIRTPRFLFFAVRQEHPVTVDVRAVAAAP